MARTLSPVIRLGRVGDGLVVREQRAHGSVLGEIRVLDNLRIRFVFELHNENALKRARGRSCERSRENCDSA